MEPYISVISPVYKAENIINELVNRIETELTKISDDYEILLIEDGSPDNSWAKIEENCIRNSKIKGIKLSRNFGQHFAITAGIAESKGDYVVVIDCDLQDDPKYIIQLVEEARKGFDIVYTAKISRKHSGFKNLTATLFTKVFNYLADNQISRTDVGGFSLITRKVASAFMQIKDSRRHYLMILRDLGFNQSYIQIEHNKRFEGKSSYNLRKLIHHALDGITFNSTKLLRISIGIGFSMCLIAFIWAIYLLYLYFSRDIPQGYTSLMVMILLSTGVILISIGITGIYIGNIFQQVKERPLYWIDKRLNM
jgi:dolichol-phosphate mannosyltransferase